MQRRLRRILLLCLLVVAGMTVLSSGFAVWANGRIRRSAAGAVFRRPADVPRMPVAIVFGAKVWRSGPSHILEDRLEAGVQLYRLRKVSKLLLSGDHGRQEYDEVNAMRSYALQRGIPPEDVFLDHAGFRTYDTLYRARDVFGVRSAVLVTNDFHLPRALYTARRLGLEVVGLASDARVYQDQRRNEYREFLACALAWVQLNVTRPRPRYLGAKIDITGDGRVTHDRP